MRYTFHLMSSPRPPVIALLDGDHLDEPLGEVAARELIQELLKRGRFNYRPHLMHRLAERNITPNDVLSVLRAGFVRNPEFADNTWRYQVYTNPFTVVIAFQPGRTLRLITAWRNS